MSFSTLHVTLILTLAIFVSIVNSKNYCFRNCALQIIAHIPPLREYILDEKNTGAYTVVMRDVFGQRLGSQRPITVQLTPFLVDESFYVCVCVLASGFKGSVVITRYQSLPLTPSKVLPICVTQ